MKKVNLRMKISILSIILLPPPWQFLDAVEVTPNHKPTRKAKALKQDAFSIPTFEAPPNDTTSNSLSNSTPSPVSNTQVTSANNNNNNNIEVNDELTIDDGDGDESISNGYDESNHKEVASTTAATQFSTISSIESTTTTYATAQTITTSTNLINNPEGFEISTTPAPPEVEEDNVFESADDVSSCAPEVLVEKSIVLPFYYQLETITFGEELLGNVELSLTAAMCSMYSDRRLGDVNAVVGWNSNPTDVVSDTCIPSNQEAEFCHVVEGGMTIYYENDDEEAIESYGYERIEDNFGSFVVDDPRVVDITYIGKDLPNGTSTTTNAVSGAEVPDSLFPTPLVATAGALLLGLMAGMYHISRGRSRKKDSPAVDAALPEAPPEAKLDDKSLSSTTPIVSNRKAIVLGEDMLGGNHYSNTIDVHKCKSAYCNCNANLNETTFLSTHSEMGRRTLGALPLDAVEV